MYTLSMYSGVMSYYVVREPEFRQMYVVIAKRFREIECFA